MVLWYYIPLTGPQQLPMLESVRDSKNIARPGGGMVDARDSKSRDSNIMRVRVSPRAPTKTSPLEAGFIV